MHNFPAREMMGQKSNLMYPILTILFNALQEDAQTL